MTNQNSELKSMNQQVDPMTTLKSAESNSMTSPAQSPIEESPQDENQKLVSSSDAFAEHAGELKRPSVLLLAIKAVFRFIASVLEWIFGFVSMIGTLAVLASIPILQFMAFGYLLEVCGRIAREGKVLSGFIGIRKFARIGGLFIGGYLMLLPLEASSQWAIAARILPADPIARNFVIDLHSFLTVLLGVHILIAVCRGGKLRHFLLPILILLSPIIIFFTLPITIPLFIFKRRIILNLSRSFIEKIHWLWSSVTALVSNPVQQISKAYFRGVDALWEFVVSMRPTYYLSLGFRGFYATAIWLVIPVLIMTAWRNTPVLGAFGAFLLSIVVLYLPFLQVHFAAQNRFSAMFELRTIRKAFLRAPVAFFLSEILFLSLAVPLYLTYIEVIPAEIAWVLGTLFIIFLLPARFLVGWAMSRAYKGEKIRHWIFRIPARLLMVPFAIVYSAILISTIYIGWNGRAGYFHQHIFLLPVPQFSVTINNIVLGVHAVFMVICLVTMILSKIRNVPEDQNPSSFQDLPESAETST